MRCEDYPCCGHTDGLPCDFTMSEADVQRVWAHYGCDHEAGDCYLYDMEESE